MSPTNHTRRLLNRTALLLAGLVAVSVHAQVVLSNLGSAGPLGSNTISTAQYVAQSFVTSGGAAAFEVESVTLRMHTAFNDSGSFFVQITSGSVPLDDLGSGGFASTLTGTANPNGNTTFTFTADNLFLQPETTYWIVLGVSTGDSTYRWRFDTSSTFQTEIWSIGNAYATSSDQGDTWSTFAIPPASPYMFSINAAAIPEPSTYAAMAGMAALGLAFWRKRRAASA